MIYGKHSKVSEKTIENIVYLVKKYNYVPNSAARMLSSNTSNIVTVFLPEADDENIFRNPHHITMLGAIENDIRKHGYFLMISSSITLKDLDKNLHAWPMAGIIMLAPTPEEVKYMLKYPNLPKVFIDSHSTEKKAAIVGIDDYRGGYLAGRYLVNCGHKNIGYASYHPDYNDILQNRFNGFSDALKDAGYPLKKENIFLGLTDYEGGLDVANQIADNDLPITAIFATADEMAIGIMEGAKLNGIDVPGQLSVMGFDNTPICRYTTPKLTTIEQDIAKKGRLAAKLLFDQIKSGKVSHRTINLPVRIVERQSVVHI
ncbi:LacI family DNA-binding transcriptional regulator [Xylanivirga thermophila]|uniref:LacI family DNA-binding transcriptional regulator n=1 Tax=Xylanivirga thermophila TaxID=2496273 RepID=UPI00101D3DFA|nr:LacI family DNA-binding transcriptional regulator [Xylanivirga thermophila]